MKIAVDIDGVLLDTMITFCEIFNARHGTSYKKSDVKRWDFYKDWNMTEEEMWEIFYQIYADSMSIPFIDNDAPGIMKELNKKYRVSIVSARDNNFRKEIIKKLEYHGIKQGSHYEKIVLVKHKPYHQKIFHHYDIYIDDNPNLAHHIMKLKNRKLLLYDQPWNREILPNKNIIRVKLWKEISIFFENLD
ncbi:MAG: 5' nucleotidase, NT5C type [Promethearchaeota archaeon]